MIYDYGVDISSNLNFTDGDVSLVEHEGNIAQSITNRLNTVQDSLDLFYYDYGSVLCYLLGWRRNDETLRVIKVEIENVLKKDSRINNFTVDLEYIPKGVKVKIVLIDFTEDVELNMVLSDDGVEVIE